MSMEGINNRGIGQAQQQDTQGVQGTLGDHQVEVGQAQPRAGNALKSFFLEVKHFFASLFGVRVSTQKPDQINNVQDGVKAVVSDFTRKNLDPLEVMKSLGALGNQCRFDRPENRNPDFTPKTDTLFTTQLGEMSDLQLLRLHTNMARNREFLEPMIQGGTATVMQLDTNPTPENMAGAGKIGDMGWLAKQLSENVVSELRARGYDVPEIQARPTDEMTPTMDEVAMRTVLNGGDVGKAVDDLRRQIINARLEDSGLPTLDQLSQPKPEPSMTPEQRNIVNQRLEQSGLPRLDGGVRPPQTSPTTTPTPVSGGLRTSDPEDRYDTVKQDLEIAGLKLQDMSSPAQMRELNRALNDAKVLYRDVFPDLDDEGIDEAVVNDLLRQVGDGGSLEVLSKLDQFAGGIREQDRDYGLLNTLYNTLSDRAPAWGRGNPFV